MQTQRHRSRSGRRRWAGLWASFGLALMPLPAPPVRAAEGETAVARAQDVLRLADFTGGLIVHLGGNDGQLTAALRANERTVVHGLARDPAKVAGARQYIRDNGQYGPVAADPLHGDRLPYAENTVNLLVVEDASGIAPVELQRVLVPAGQLLQRSATGWTRTVKPRPDDIDDWTHFLHDASGNPVARDERVGPPRRLQWSADPCYTMDHEHTPSIAALVSSGGRLFYIADEGPAESVLVPPQWQLLARDAYNGLLLWRQPVSSWWPRAAIWTSGPRQLQRRLVATGDRVYATLGYYDPVSALDANSGRTLRVYEETRGAEEVIWHAGTVLVAVREVTAERVAELGTWSELGAQPDSPLRRRETMDPWLKRLRGIETKVAPAIVAIVADSGRVLWRREAPGLAPLTLCALGGRVFCQLGGQVTCLDLQTGEPQWAVRAPRLRLVCEQAVICADGRTVTALAPDTGQTTWTQAPLLCDVRDAFVIGGSLWLGGFRPFDTGNAKHTGPVWGPYFATAQDLRNGALLKQIQPENPGHHHRCYQSKATGRYILGGRRGTEFIDLLTGEVLWHSWARGVCMYGVMPANGLLYLPSHACGCYVTTRLIGFNALAPGTASPEAPEGSGTAPTPAPEIGPAYPGSPSPPPALAAGQEWPTYRRDDQRSGSTATVVPATLRLRWQSTPQGRLTAPVVAAGRVLAAATEEHRVLALDAESGKTAWDFTAGARVDSPPTVWDGHALFGCRDGYVYSVRLADGALAWRLRAARTERRVVVDGQLEAATPVHGSVLVREGVVYATAGRSSYLDGGIDLCRIEAASGRLLSRTPIYSPDPATGRQPAQYNANSMPGARTDLLSGDADHVYLRDLVFDPAGAPMKEGNAHLFAVTGFLDDAWAHRSYWIFGQRCSLATGCSGRAKDLLYGRLLVFDENRVCGYGRRSVHWSNALEDGPYEVFAKDRVSGRPLWARELPVRVRGMMLAGNLLFVAGASGPEGEASREPATELPGQVVALSVTDGSEQARCALSSPPGFDGLAAAYGRLYLTTTAGRLVCLAGTGP